MMSRDGKTPKQTRRRFLKNTATMSAATAAAVTGVKGHAQEFMQPKEGVKLGAKSVTAQCPYCGVGCGTLIQVDTAGKMVGIVPDAKHPTNKGIQCIKGLTAHEPIYVDRLQKVLVRKDMSDPATGHVSATKGQFGDDVFREATYEEASHLVAEKVAGYVKKFGGNSIALYGSGQLTLEGQYLENQFMKGVLGSNTIEANARMCMTSAVTAYFKTLGSDTPPGCYDDIEMADFISFWGHNPREAHSVLYWRVADTKMDRDIPTMVVDPRYTGTVQGFEDINIDNTYHAQIEPNSDISLLNSIGHVLLRDHDDVIAWDFMKENVENHEAYIAGLKERYSPEQTAEITGLDPEEVEEYAGLWADATRKGNERGTGGVMTFWGIGYNQSIHGQHNAISIINLHLLTGNIGRPGAAPFSQTGQPNAMGERLTGGLTGRLPFNQGLGNVEHRDFIADQWGVPRERLAETATKKNAGYAIGMMERALKGGDDLVAAMFLIYTTHINLPETNTLVRPALEKMFVIAQEIYRHAPNNLYADVIFPAATWGEVGGVYVQSERRLYVTDKAAEPPAGCKPDLDIVIDKGKEIGHLLGLDVDKMFPYEKNEQGFYKVEDVFRALAAASKGSDADISGILEVEKATGKTPYEQIRDQRGIQWPAPTAEIASRGGTPRRYMGQEADWADKPYGNFRRGNGKAAMHLCEQDYSQAEEILAELAKCGTDPNFFITDNMDLLVKARDMGLTPELPDFEFRGKGPAPEGKYPFWLNLGVVYEHFPTAKTIRSAPNNKLLMEQYVEMHEDDADRYGIEDGDLVRVVTRRGSYEARASIGLDSIVKPARNEVQEGSLFTPWNLSVADGADPKENKWLVNAVAHRAFDPVSGQADFKKLAARIEKV